MNLLRELNLYIGKRYKFKFILIWFLNLIASIVEVSFVALLASYISLILDYNSFLRNTPDIFNDLILNRNKSEIIFYFSLILLFLVIVKNIFLSFVIYLENFLIYNLRLQNSDKIFKNYIYNNYNFYIKSNPAKLIKNLTTEFDRAHNYLLQSFTLIRECLIAFFIFILLAQNNFVATVVVFFLVTIFVLSFYFILKDFLKKKGEIARTSDEGRMNTIQNIFGAFKSIKLLNAEENFVKDFKNDIQEQNKSELYMRVIPRLPRLILETLVLILIICPVIYISINATSNFDLFLGTLSLFAVCALRLIPSYSTISSTLSSLRYLFPSFKNLLYELKLSVNKPNTIIKNKVINLKNEKFNNLEIKDLSFKYPNANKFILNNLNFNVVKNTILGFIGPSGSGKSTLIDILLGFFEPSGGKVYLNGKEKKFDELYSNKIFGYVPQDIYILNTTISKNIALGLRDQDIDEKKVYECLEKANLLEYIKSLPDGIHSKIEHRGINLSGGQIQRLGIARAFYFDPQIIILDESTNALDRDTENKILQEIVGLKEKYTFLIVSHKQSTVSICDNIYSLSDEKFTKKIS